MMKTVESAPVRPSSSVPAIAGGRPATMPAKMMSRDAVAEAAGGDLLGPATSRKHRATNQGDDGGDAGKEPAWIRHDVRACLQSHGDAVGLNRRQKDRAVARVLVDDLAALLAFLLQLLQRSARRPS